MAAWGGGHINVFRDLKGAGSGLTCVAKTAGAGSQGGAAGRPALAWGMTFLTYLAPAENDLGFQLWKVPNLRIHEWCCPEQPGLSRGGLGQAFHDVLSGSQVRTSWFSISGTPALSRQRGAALACPCGSQAGGWKHG